MKKIEHSLPQATFSWALDNLSTPPTYNKDNTKIAVRIDDTNAVLFSRGIGFFSKSQGWTIEGTKQEIDIAIAEHMGETIVDVEDDETLVGYSF